MEIPAIARRKAERKRVLEEARAWARGLQGPVTVVLIGSYARGDFNEGSDVDLLVISDRFEGMKPHERIMELNAPPGYEPIPLTTREFQWGLEKRKPHAVEALERGVVLRDDLGLFTHGAR